MIFRKMTNALKPLEASMYELIRQMEKLNNWLDVRVPNSHHLPQNALAIVHRERSI